MKNILLYILLLAAVMSYGQGFLQEEKIVPPKRTTPYKAKPAPPSAQAAEKARIVEMEKELQEADAAFEKEEYDKALAIYIKYKEHLDGEQCWNLGYMYYTTKDYTQAFYWYKKAAEAGNSYGMNGLGIYYYNGEGTTKDYNQAFYWFKKAAEAGNSYAMNNLADCYYNGEGTTKDLEKAKYWYKKACEAGNQRGCDNLKNLN